MKKTIATISMSFFALLFFGLIFSLILSYSVFRVYIFHQKTVLTIPDNFRVLLID